MARTGFGGTSSGDHLVMMSPARPMNPRHSMRPACRDRRFAVASQALNEEGVMRVRHSRAILLGLAFMALTTAQVLAQDLN